MNLGQRIIRQIEANGPMSVADYMAMCLFDRDAGYYTTREPFGKDGDFITAPEISQMFGELVGCLVCQRLASAWVARRFRSLRIWAWTRHTYERSHPHGRQDRTGFYRCR